MRKLLAFLGMAAALFSEQTREYTVEAQKELAESQLMRYASNPSFHGAHESGDPRKAARNRHRKMKASGRHNWRTA
jgi:hypothetical protein